MKKLAIASVLALMVSGASATQVGVFGGHNSHTGQEFAGVSVSTKKNDVTFDLGLDRSTVGSVNLNRVTLTGAKQIWSVKNVGVSVKVGGAYLDPSVGYNGAAALFGVGLQYPLTKTVSLTGDYVYQYGQGRVEQFNGNTFVAGAKFKF